MTSFVLISQNPPALPDVLVAALVLQSKSTLLPLTQLLLSGLPNVRLGTSVPPIGQAFINNSSFLVISK
jgi:hypothetical protein